jgi:uncharacterized damage-inducible protein DinB
MRSHRIGSAVVSFFILAQFAAHGQDASTNPYTAELKVQYRDVRRDLIESAETMPANKYDFRPTPDVRSFGQLVGHLIDDEYAICALAREERTSRDPSESAERAGGSKDQLVQGLRKAFEYCDAVYEPLTDVTAAQRVRSYDGTMQPRIQLLMINTHHANVHYGNVIVYLRMNGIVPPSTARTK